MTHVDARLARRVTLILVTDPRFGDERIADVVRAAAVVPGFCVQLRDRTERTDDDLEPLASRLREITVRAGALFVVNRRLALARRVSADGFHAPASELAAARDFAFTSAPTHSDEELQNARIAGATAALVSPIFEGKVAPRGIEAIRAARAIAPGMLLAALGGVDAQSARVCREAGADAVAVVRALLAADDPAAVAKSLAHGVL